MSICERIRYIRKEIGLSQSAFGNQLGTTRDVISNIENGRVDPSGIIINLICSTFNVSKEWLENEKGDKYRVPESDDKFAEAIASISLSDNEKLKELIGKLSDLDDKYIDALDILINGIISDRIK